MPVGEHAPFPTPAREDTGRDEAQFGHSRQGPPPTGRGQWPLCHHPQPKLSHKQLLNQHEVTWGLGQGRCESGAGAPGTRSLYTEIPCFWQNKRRPWPSYSRDGGHSRQEEGWGGTAAGGGLGGQLPNPWAPNWIMAPTTGREGVGDPLPAMRAPPPNPETPQGTNTYPPSLVEGADMRKPCTRAEPRGHDHSRAVGCKNLEAVNRTELKENNSLSQTPYNLFPTKCHAEGDKLLCVSLLCRCKR